jgi:hypothetical protein
VCNYEASRFSHFHGLLVDWSPSDDARRPGHDHLRHPELSVPTGHTVTGTITTDGHIGQLGPSDITSWSVTIGGTITFRSTDLGAETMIAGAVDASLTAIILAAPTTSGESNTLALFGAPTGAPALVWDRELTSGGLSSDHYVGTTTSSFWASLDLTLGGKDPWVLAAVPEPSSPWMAVSGISAVFACDWFRRRRDPRRQRAVGPSETRASSTPKVLQSR